MVRDWEYIREIRKVRERAASGYLTETEAETLIWRIKVAARNA